MHNLTRIIVEFLSERHGPAYAASKAAELEGHRSFYALFFAALDLDMQNRATLAMKLGISSQELETTLKVLKIVHNL